jgi:hypothetical protein
MLQAASETFFNGRIPIVLATMEHMTGADLAFTNAVTSTNKAIAALNEATVVATVAANKAAATIAANKATAAKTFDCIPATKQQTFLFAQQAVLFTFSPTFSHSCMSLASQGNLKIPQGRSRDYNSATILTSHACLFMTGLRLQLHDQLYMSMQEGDVLHPKPNQGEPLTKLF